MTATRTVWSPNYYKQGWTYGPPGCVVLHSTRSGRPDFSDAEECAATVSWFLNPESYASSHWVISETERVRMVPDEYPSWHAGWHSWQGYGIEITQPVSDRRYTDGHYENLVEVCVPYVRRGIPIVRIDYLEYASTEKGFVGHEDTEQGWSVGKTDPGVMFDYSRFFAQLRNACGPIEEDDMKPVIVKAPGDTTQYVCDGLTLRGIPTGQIKKQLIAKGLVEPGVKPITDELLAWLKAAK